MVITEVIFSCFMEDFCISSTDATLVSISDVTHILCELELSIERVKVTTTPDGRVLDLFFITDNL